MSHRLLIISSCTKKKSIPNIHNITWSKLNSSDKRNEILKGTKHNLLPAKELYTGQQMKLILEGIDILRKYVTVDHFIISAGFGLISENQLLPSYESTFSNLTKKEILDRSRNLEIISTLTELNFSLYGLVYLALGKEYLHSISPMLSNIDGTEVVHFDRELIGLDNFVQLYETPLLGNKDDDLLERGIGSSMNAKGGILLNYANWIDNYGRDGLKLSFTHYWGLLKQRYNLK